MRIVLSRCQRNTNESGDLKFSKEIEVGSLDVGIYRRSRSLIRVMCFGLWLVERYLFY